MLFLLFYFYNHHSLARVVLNYSKTVVNDSSATIILDVYPTIGSNNGIAVLEPKASRSIWLRTSSEEVNEDAYEDLK